MNGMPELRNIVDGMGRLEAALTVMAPVMATKEDRDQFKTAMETRFEAISKRLEVMGTTMQGLQSGWAVVPEDDNSGESWGGDRAWHHNADGSVAGAAAGAPGRRRSQSVCGHSPGLARRSLELGDSRAMPLGESGRPLGRCGQMPGMGRRHVEAGGSCAMPPGRRRRS